MTGKKMFHFKAATGFGVVVDGSVLHSSAERVGRELALQGLLPIRIWAEQNATRPVFTQRLRSGARSFFTRKITSSPDAV